jgi:hydrogenase nickel incorporation protein HypA/HybF
MAVPVLMPEKPGMKGNRRMHEYGLTKQIVNIVNGTALKYGAEKVNAVHLVVGENTSIIPESVQMYYNMIAKDKAAQGAMLYVRLIKAEMRCPSCGKNFQRPLFSFACPQCGALGAPTDIGNEFYVESVELEE